MEENIQQKQTWVALRHALAKQVHCTEKEAAVFLESLVHQLTLALQDNQAIRINSLGTFRLQAVAPRKSVHVGTGEAITIAGYNKLTFVPESSVKESMNDTATPKLTPETDPLRKLGEQADEIIGILAEMGQTPSQTKQPDDKTPETPQEEVIEQPLETETQKIVEQPLETEPQEIVEQQLERPIAEKVLPPKTSKKQEKNHTGLIILLTACFFILLCIGAYFFMQHKLVAWMDSLREKVDGTELVATEKLAEDEIIVIEKSDEVDSTESTIEGDSSDEIEEIVQPQYQSFITTEEMHADSRLAWMAYRYWGKKDLWVYIYDANRDRISNPNLIKVGTPIRIPRLTKEQQDLNNPDTQRFIEQIQSEFK